MLHVAQYYSYANRDRNTHPPTNYHPLMQLPTTTTTHTHPKPMPLYTAYNRNPNIHLPTIHSHRPHNHLRAHTHNAPFPSSLPSLRRLLTVTLMAKVAHPSLSIPNTPPPVIVLGEQINLSTFAFLFSEIVQYSHNRVESIPELETKCAPPPSLLAPACRQSS